MEWLKMPRTRAIALVGMMASMSLQCNDNKNEDTVEERDGGNKSGKDSDSDTESERDSRSKGCGKEIEIPESDVQQTMDVDGTTRYYLLDVPEDADNQSPLVLIFALHGYDMNNVAIVDRFNFTSRSDGQAITVFPQGEGPPPGDVSHWGDHVLESTWTNNEANYTFIRKLKTDIEERFCIDKDRVFITGFSMGGFFTNTIACEHNDWFRGYAPISAGGPDACADTDTKSAIMIHHGTADNIVSIESGEGSRDFWVQQNECEQSSTTSFSGCVTYEGCADRTPVAYCVGDWDHYIPFVVPGNIWSFFSSLE